MMSEGIVDKLPLWLLFLGTASLLAAGNFAGFRFGLWQRSRRAEDDKAPASAIMGSTLGLLAFILAFTFGMSSTRFDTRRNLVLEEAGAIMTAYQRAQFLPEPQNAACSDLLRDYVELRLSMPAMNDMTALREAVRRSEDIQDRLWAQAAALSAKPNAILSTFIQSLSTLTDLQMKRVRAAVWNRIPTTIETMLYVLAFMGLMTMGYNAGLAGTRPTLPTMVLVFAFSAIIVLIMDLERPRQTLFQVSQEPMMAVQRRMTKTAPDDRQSAGPGVERAGAAEEDPMNIHYLEIVTGDVDGVCAVYARLHGIEFSAPVAELGNARTARLPSGGRVGVRAPLHETEEPVVRPYLLVDDIESATAAAAAGGAEIAHPPLEIPGLGTFAIYIQGGVHHGLWQM